MAQQLALAKLLRFSSVVFWKSPKCVGIVSVQFSDPAVILLLSGRDPMNTGQGQRVTELESGDEKKILKSKCLWPTSKHTHGKHEHTDIETDLHEDTDTQMHRHVLPLISVNFLPAWKSNQIDPPSLSPDSYFPLPFSCTSWCGIS